MHRLTNISFTSESPSWVSQLPLSPGIYIFEDKHGQPLYIGKSVSLRSRIRQHLESSKDPASKQSLFVPETYSLRYQETNSDLEAIILESYLIKTADPKYNVLAKDDKSVTYIVITNSPDSKIQLAHSTDLNLSYFDNPSTQIYGPYLAHKTAFDLLKQTRRIFGFCQNPFNSQNRPCFYYHLHQCPGPCAGKISADEYQKHLTQIKRFLSGQFKYLIKDFRKQINELAKGQNFEEASRLKTQLERLEWALNTPQLSGFLEYPQANQNALKEIVTLLRHPQLSSPPYRIECYDIAHLQGDQIVGGMSVLINGQPRPDEYRHFLIRTAKPGDQYSLKEIVSRRFNHTEWPWPSLLVLDGGVSQLSTVSPVIPENVPVIALSKRRETIHFYRDGRVVNLNLPPHKASLKILQTVRDEAHRFTTTFHQSRRRKALLG